MKLNFQPLKKAAAHWSTYWGLLAIYFVTLLFDQEGARALAVPVVAGIVGLSGISQGLNVADNAQRARHYIPELDKTRDRPAKEQ